jgi:DNA-binding transcriptional regulator YdaS (Cro superfamily)
MTASFTAQQMRDHFAHCVQVLGGTAAAARRLDIDERAIRRFINAERPMSATLLEDTAKALRRVIAEATSAEALIVAALGTQSDDREI